MFSLTGTFGLKWQTLASLKRSSSTSSKRTFVSLYISSNSGYCFGKAHSASPLLFAHTLSKDDLEPDTEERAMAVLWSAPEAIEKKVLNQGFLHLFRLEKVLPSPSLTCETSFLQDFPSSSSGITSFEFHFLLRSSAINLMFGASV